MSPQQMMLPRAGLRGRRGEEMRRRHARRCAHVVRWQEAIQCREYAAKVMLPPRDAVPPLVQQRRPAAAAVYSLPFCRSPCRRPNASRRRQRRRCRPAVV